MIDHTNGVPNGGANGGGPNGGDANGVLHPNGVPHPRAGAAVDGRSVAGDGTHPVVRVEHATAGYDDLVALEDVSLEIPTGALVAVVGPNGGGKSTLLKLFAGLLQPWSGTVEVLGQRPGVAAKRIAYVPQAELVDWSFPVSVFTVAMMGRYPRIGPLRRPGRADHDAVRAALERVGMTDRARSRIGELSGGQRRRAFLARAIAAEADLYLLDEPVTGVDVPTIEAIMALLADEADEGKAVVATTHDLAAASRHFRSLIAVNRRVVASGPADLITNPDVLAATYGGHLLYLGEKVALLDDSHHHDEARGAERHFHEGGREGKR